MFGHGLILKYIQAKRVASLSHIALSKFRDGDTHRSRRVAHHAHESAPLLLFLTTGVRHRVRFHLVILQRAL